VEESLRRRSCTECLQWCAENRAKLRKTKSDLEFQLRQQEFIELVRTDQLAAAIQYVRKHLVPFMDTHAAAIQRVRARARARTSTVRRGDSGSGADGLVLCAAGGRRGRPWRCWRFPSRPRRARATKSSTRPSGGTS